MLKLVLGLLVVCAGAGMVWMAIIAAPISGVGVHVVEVPRVWASTYKVDANGLAIAERVLFQYAKERGLPASRMEIPVEGRQALLLQISLMPSATTLTAENTAAPNRLEVWISTNAPSVEWKAAMFEIERRLQAALGEVATSSPPK